jgi:predicted adenylyl cyclase CyaB
MAANIEIKARALDPALLHRRAAAISDTPAQVIYQRDVFFDTPRGRLKLRVLEPDRAQLVYYERPDKPGPRISTYHISDTSDPDSLEQLLSSALGVRGQVCKVRTLYMVRNTRIHLDEVQGLGGFIELEAVLGPDQSAEEGYAAVNELVGILGIRESDLVDMAYIDLLEQTSG